MLRSAYWLATALFVGLVAAKFSPTTGFTSLIRFGETWQSHRHSALASLPIATAKGSNGYDGQFYAQLALDPTLRDREFPTIIDAPAYRARRILLPATACLLGLGHPGWILQAYALLNILCWLALAWILRDLIGQASLAGFARWFGCMFSVGVLESVRQSLVDLPALLFLALAVRAYAQPARATRPTLWLAFANLTKETSLLGAFALHGDALFDRARRSKALLTLFLASLPLALWSWYVSQRFSASDPGLGNFTWPFVAIYTQSTAWIQHIAAGNFDSRYTFGLLALAGFIVQTAVLWRDRQFKNPWWRIGALYSLLLPFLGVWVWSGYWATCRAVLPLTVAFNLLLPANRLFWPLWTIGNLTALHALWRFL